MMNEPAADHSIDPTPESAGGGDDVPSSEMPTTDFPPISEEVEALDPEQQLFAERSYWLFKSDPDTYGIDELEAEPDRTTLWDGVRNYQARNLLRDKIKRGDEVLFYHSRSSPPGVLGLATVTREGYADPTQFDPSAKYHDPKATESNPIWYCVDIKLVRRLRRIVTLSEMKAHPELQDMMVCRKGARLSIQPVSREHYNLVRALGQ